jgi:N-acetyl-gamma-glutamylphosphate reductase
MKLIISGGSGYVAGELIRQSLRMPEITSLVVLSRRPVTIPDHANAHKVKQVVVQDYDKYSDEAKKEFAGAAACIW